MQSYSDAFHAMHTAAAPATLKWSSSFGYLGENGFCEYWRDEDGTRYVISNGTWCERRWSVHAIHTHAFNAHVLDYRYGQTIDTHAEMLAAMRWAESGVNYFRV